VARALVLVRQGLAQRVVAERLRAEGLADVSQQAVSSAIRRHEAKHGAEPRRKRDDPRTRARRGGGAKAKKRRPRPASARRRPAKRPEDRLAAIRDELGELGGGALDVLQAIRTRRLPQVSAIADQAHADQNFPLYKAAAELELKLAQQIVAAMPPAPLPPEQDPANLEARDRVRAELDRLSGRLQQQLAEQLCDQCRVHLGSTT